MGKDDIPYIQVYCPELKAMIRPGEWALCPYFSGKRLNLNDTEEAIKQIFRCHVQCGCEIQYQYYEGDDLITKKEKIIRDPENLRKILKLVAGVKEKKERKPATVLIADDDADFLEMHSTVLRHRGYDVVTASSAEECLAKLDEAEPDIVVLDVMMEHIDSGFQTCRTIKEKRHDLPVILLTAIGAQTGMAFSSSDDLLVETGADVLMDKPVSPKIFIDTIERLLHPEKNHKS
jgi:CheY-like chemotaxis protein